MTAAVTGEALCLTACPHDATGMHSGSSRIAAGARRRRHEITSLLRRRDQRYTARVRAIAGRESAGTPTSSPPSRKRAGGVPDVVATAQVVTATASNATGTESGTVSTESCATPTGSGIAPTESGEGTRFRFSIPSAVKH